MQNMSKNLNVYFGDIHNHCKLSYGNGSLSNALYNAQLQLDFTSVTVHAVWPDLPTDDPKLEYLIDYHEQGFIKAKANWGDYLQTIEQHNVDDQFITFPSFEWHSIKYGDHCVYYKQSADNPIIDAPDLPSLRESLRKIKTPAFLIPHHIGYKQGSRGINWQTFTDEMSPVAEIFSFHGLSESSEGPYPYLHSMGPRHEHSTAQYGWSQGNIFGVVGSTDHHNAFPGSYGYGRMGVWAESLSRDAIWDAIQNRRTYALTGDRIELGFSLNEMPLGSICSADSSRWIDVDVRASDVIDYIEVLHNNQIIHRENILPKDPRKSALFKVYIEMGWAEQATPYDWDVSIDVELGTIHHVEPRFRGYGPSVKPEDDNFAYTQLDYNDDNYLRLRTKTRQNTSLHTATTEGICLEIKGTLDTCLVANINGQIQKIQLCDIMTGSRTFYTGGFVSPAICFHQAVPEQDYTHRFAFTHHNHTSNRDWYYVRVRQRNNQWAWSSPIWIDGEKP